MTPTPDHTDAAASATTERPLSSSQVLTFLKSCILSGEDWSATCQQEFTSALDQIDSDKATIARLEAEVERLREALTEMVTTQSEWEDAVGKIIQHPPKIFDRAIDRARTALQERAP